MPTWMSADHKFITDPKSGFDQHKESVDDDTIDIDVELYGRSTVLVVIAISTCYLHFWFVLAIFVMAIAYYHFWQCRVRQKTRTLWTKMNRSWILTVQSADLRNQLGVTEYAEELYKFYRENEVIYLSDDTKLSVSSCTLYSWPVHFACLVH
jgi:predicted membrane protein